IEWSDPKKDDQDFHRMTFQLRTAFSITNLPMSVVTDMTVSNFQYSLEGDETVGYRITLVAPGSQAQDLFVTREDGHYKLVELAISSSKPPENLAWEVLARLEQKDLAGARKWLDWAREKVHLNTGDDPLSGQVFPHFWTKGQEGDESAIRKAALVLLSSKDLTGSRLTTFIQERNNSKNETERTMLSLVLAYAYAAQEKWTELLPVAESLMQAVPDSLTAFEFAAQACAGLHKFDDWERMVQARLQKHPDDPDYIHAAARLALRRSQFAKARDLYKGLMDRGKATEQDLNGFAWYALSVPGPIDRESIDAAQRANELTKNADSNILHTLACLEAAVGKTTQARDLLFKAMDTAQEEEPGPEIWFGFGTIAEEYGEYDAARAMYVRMEKPKTDSPGSSYALGQQRLAALPKTAADASKGTGQ
ncbi:MAG TPA: hypothetical protein VJ723_11275, partial [Candidatus Angelobacter sp.]|nr:hypothetical protein [Candidatus Angelobacter sp.]